MELVPAGFERPLPSKRLERPAWLGIRATHRRAAADTVMRHTKAAGGRILFETFKGLPWRGWLVLRRFVLGMRGWVGLFAWVFAVAERNDVAMAATASKQARGRGVSSGRNADRLSWWRGGVIVIPHMVGFFAIRHYLDPDWLQWFVFAPAVVATVVYGAMHDTKPAPTLAAPRRRTDITVETLNAALRAVGILDKPTAQRQHPDGVSIARMPRPVGGGWEVVFDLPASIKFEAADVVKARGRLASSFATPLPQLQVEQGAHPGQVVIWQAPHDPFAAKPKLHPLLDDESWSVFEPIPFGYDSRSRPVNVPIFGTHFLVGAVPNAGKTMTCRVLSAGAVLDPHADIYVFDGKMGKDWAAVEPIATVYEAGPIREQARRLFELLQTFLDDGDDRFAAMKAMTDEECPNNELTPAMAAKGMHFRWLVVDEGHRHIGDEKYGDQITRLLVDYVKGYRAVGFGLLFCTQDADATLADRFTTLRRVTGSRFALRVMDWQASNMLLGDQMNTRGFNAADILPTQKGTGILRGDADADGQADAVARTVRTYFMDNADWAALCEVGRQLRGGALQALPGGGVSEPVYATPTELFPLLADRAPDVLGAAGVTDVHSMGMKLPITKHHKKVNRRGVYDLRRVELALGLEPGSLDGPTDPPPADDGDDPVPAPCHPGGTP